MNINLNIKQIIVKKELKHCAIARKIGMTSQQFSDMLNGRRTMKATDIVKLCEALNVTPNELLGFSNLQ